MNRNKFSFHYKMKGVAGK